MDERHDEAVRLWRFPRLGRETGLLHFVSTRDGGVSAEPFDSLNLSFSAADRREYIVENRRRLATALGLRLEDFVSPRQVHGNTVLAIDRDQGGAGAAGPATSPGEADALVTATPGVMLMLMLADCVPVIVYDRVRRVAGIAHAGWKGTVRHVSRELLQRMTAQFGCKAANLRAAIGPSIGPCCYEVGEDVVRRVQNELTGAEGLLLPHPTAGKAYLDLWRANQLQLLDFGIQAEQIEIAEVCTKCHADTFFSDRAQRPTGRFGAGVMLLSEQQEDEEQ